MASTTTSLATHVKLIVPNPCDVLLADNIHQMDSHSMTGMKSSNSTILPEPEVEDPSIVLLNNVLFLESIHHLLVAVGELDRIIWHVYSWQHFWWLNKPQAWPPMYRSLSLTQLMSFVSIIYPQVAASSARYPEKRLPEFITSWKLSFGIQLDFNCPRSLCVFLFSNWLILYLDFHHFI